jgi:hypothetical protein
MTIVASVKVRDGLVLSTDSMTTIASGPPGAQQIVKAYENARKLFQFGDLPVGAMTYGLGNIGERSMEGLVLDYCRDALGATATVPNVAQGLYDYIRPLYDTVFVGTDPAQLPDLGFIVAGYSHNAAGALPEVYEFVIPRDAAPAEVLAAQWGAAWRGVDSPFTRLYRGFDPVALQIAAAQTGADLGQLQASFDPFTSPVVFDGMPVQDAVNFATYILKTTIHYTTFASAVSPCGGPLQVATILPDRGFTWLSEPAHTIAL